MIPITSQNIIVYAKQNSCRTSMTDKTEHRRRPHPAKIDLNIKWLPKQKTIQNFDIDAKGFRKTRNENPPTREIGVTS